MKFSAHLVAFAVLLLVLVPFAQADTLQYTSNTISCEPTDWGPENLTLTKWYPLSELWVLESIKLELFGSVSGTIRYENTGATARLVTGYLQADIDLFDPSNNLLLSVLPSDLRQDNLPEFDGTLDFGGASGRTYTGVSGDDSDIWYTTNPVDFATFTGAAPGETIDLSAWAYGSSYATGGGNVASQFITDACAYAQITYEYSIIPEPGTMALLGLGVVGLGAWRRRKRS